MNEQNTQDPTAHLSDDAIAAVLGLSTSLSSGHHELNMPSDTPQDQQGTDPNAAPASTDIPSDPEVEQKNDKVLTEIQGLRDDLMTIVAPKPVEQEIADIRQQLKDLKMNRTDKINALKARLDVLTTPKVSPFTDSLINDELKKQLDSIRANVENNVTTRAIEKLQKDVAGFATKLDMEPIFEALKKADGENKKSLSTVQKNFEARIAPLVRELQKPQDTLSSAEILTQIDAVRSSLQEQLVPLTSRDALLASEVDRLQQEIGKMTTTFVESTNTQEASTQELQKGLLELEKRLLSRIGSLNNHGGNMNRNIAVGGNSSVLSRYTDINLKAGSNVTITAAINNTTKYTDITIASSGGGGGSGYQAALSGVVNGSNTVFTWTTEPNALVVDGVSIRKTQSDGTNNWTGTTTTTLAVAPNFDIYAVA